MLSDQSFQRAEMTVRQVFETASALGNGLLGGGEGFDDAQEMVVVVAEL
jgi:hypothetical protein